MTTNRRRAPTSSRPTAVRVRALVGIACAGLAAVVLGAAGEGLQRALAVDDTVMVKMRDGVHLAATVYRPADADRLPTLVTRTPYDRRNDATEARKLAARGYVVVVQDTRGRFGSEGEFYPFRDDDSPLMPRSSRPLWRRNITARNYRRPVRPLVRPIACSISSSTRLRMPCARPFLSPPPAAYLFPLS